MDSSLNSSLSASLTSKVNTNDFLKLLTIQLQNQDPINPVNQQDFIGQLTQFSQLENAEESNASFKSMLKVQQVSQGVSLVGKQVSYLDSDTGETKAGNVSEFFVQDGNVNLMIGGKSISIDDVSGVIGSLQ